MKKKAGLALAVLMLTGCEIALSDEVRKFAEEQTKNCDGKVEKVAVVKAAEGGNHYEGLAEVRVGEEEYSLNMKIKTGAAGSILEAENDVCAEHAIKTGIRQIFGN